MISWVLFASLRVVACCWWLHVVGRCALLSFLVSVVGCPCLSLIMVFGVVVCAVVGRWCCVVCCRVAACWYRLLLFAVVARCC